MEALAILERTWTDAQNAKLTASAYALLSAVDTRLTTPAKASWRWRILLLRASLQASANPCRLKRISQSNAKFGASIATGRTFAHRASGTADRFR